jgi:hypothetical protein
VGDLGAQRAPGEVSAVPIDDHHLGGVGEVHRVGDRGRADPAVLQTAVTTLHRVVRKGTRPLGELIDRTDQARLVVLDHQQVVGRSVADQVPRVGALGVQGICGDDLPARSTRSSSGRSSAVLSLVPAWRVVALRLLSRAN